MQIARPFLLSMTVIVALVLAAGIANGEDRKAPFVDEGAKDATFADYRKKLLQAIIDRDVDAVVAAAAPDIHLDFGGGEAANSFAIA